MNGDKPSLGKILIEINIDTYQYNVGFSNPDTIKLLHPAETQNLMSPFQVMCIINEIKRRQEDAGKKIIPAFKIPKQ